MVASSCLSSKQKTKDHFIRERLEFTYELINKKVLARFPKNRRRNIYLFREPEKTLPCQVTDHDSIPGKNAFQKKILLLQSIFS